MLDPVGGDGRPNPVLDLAGRDKPPILVLDANVWFDCYFFHDPGVLCLQQALAAGRWRAVRCAATDDELARVGARPGFADPHGRRWLGGSLPEALARWQALANCIETLRPAPWICRDPDDQKFLELAVSAPASLLLTKDKALLALARPARAAGLAILPPGQAQSLLAAGPD